MQNKLCTACHELLPLSDFNVKYRSPSIRYYSRCKKCTSDAYKEYRHSYAKKYYEENRERLINKQKETYYKDIEKSRRAHSKSQKKNRAKNRDRIREYGKQLRIRFLEMYGNKCVCCGEFHLEFLTIEHKLGQKGIVRHRKQTGRTAYSKAIQEYRPDLYEVLCWNCNCAKGRYGYCPHQKEKI